jgi:hypothetical protein
MREASSAGLVSRRLGAPGAPEGVKIHFTTNLAEAQPNGIKSSISDAYATSSCSISQMSALTTPHDTPKHNYTYSVKESGVSKARKKVSYFCGKMNSDTPWWAHHTTRNPCGATVTSVRGRYLFGLSGPHALR